MNGSAREGEFNSSDKSATRLALLDNACSAKYDAQRRQRVWKPPTPLFLPLLEGGRLDTANIADYRGCHLCSL
jgi:hypothetical protein